MLEYASSESSNENGLIVKNRLHKKGISQSKEFVEKGGINQIA